MAIITHHCGGLIPLMEGRIEHGLDYAAHRNPPEAMSMTTREPPISGLRRFYADTASFGSRIPLKAARQFFGVDRMLFASDMPFDPEEGPGFIRAGIRLLGGNVADGNRTPGDSRRQRPSAPRDQHIVQGTTTCELRTDGPCVVVQR